MTRIESRSQVGSGFYFNTSSWDLHAVDGSVGELPGAEGTRWVRLNTPMMIVAAAVLSLGFVIFLPVIGFVLVARVVGGALLEGLKRALQSLAHALAPQWQPGEAWFARRDDAPHTKHGSAEPGTQQLQDEVGARRTDEENRKEK